MNYLVPQVKSWAGRAGIDGFLREMYVEVGLLGERARFVCSERPNPSTTILLAGSGRSDTTWLAKMLSALPGIQQLFEPLFPLWNAEVR